MRRVNDTVKYKDLVPGKKYTLSASLVDKSDESKVLGRGTKEFTPDEANGEVVVPITVDQSVTEPVKAAVAFEELSSTEVTAEGEDSPKGLTPRRRPLTTTRLPSTRTSTMRIRR